MGRAPAQTCAGYGPGTADGAGRTAVLADPRYRRRKPLPEADETQRTVITAADFLLIAAALLWQLARNAQGMTDESRIGTDRKAGAGVRTESLETPGQYYRSGGITLTQGSSCLATSGPHGARHNRAEHQYLNQLSAGVSG